MNSIMPAQAEQSSRGEFVLWYIPVVGLKTGQNAGSAAGDGKS
jgi:hypothetical protein